MNRKYNNWFFGGLLSLLAIFGISSCSDDHYDVGTMTEANGTLWENIVATHKCDSFAMILQKTLVNKEDYGIPVTLTYDNLLKSNKVVTVWAPVDGTYNAAKWLKLLEEGDNETVEDQFVANHIAYFNYNGSYPQNQRILLANGKYVNYDNTVSPNTFHGVNISTQMTNIPATNGTLHILDEASTFVPNLREILPLYDNLSKLSEYIDSRDTIVFQESQSTVGTTVNGVVHYVDSVFYEYNKIYPSYSETEDSCFAAIFPSNTAWDEAFEKVAKNYNYMTIYPYVQPTTTATQVSTDSVKADSLREYYTVQAMINNMFYSLDEQPAFDVEQASVPTVTDFFSNTCDSLVSKTYYKSSYKYHQHAPECRELTEKKEPIEASNGYAFITDHFNFKANNSWQFDIELEAENLGYVNQSDKVGSSGWSQSDAITLTTATRNPYVLGVVGNNKFRRFAPTASNTSKMTVVYNIPNVLSGKYDIYVVLVPENITDTLNTSPKYNVFTATITPYFKQASATKLTDMQSQTVGTSTKYLQNDPTKVDTVLLFSDFEFPYAYQGVPNAMPVIKINSVISNRLSKVATGVMNIDKFILRSKDE